MKAEPEKKGGLTLTPTERTSVAETKKAVQAANTLGLSEEECAYAVEVACGEFMGNQQRSYKAVFPEVTDNYASTRSTELQKRERVTHYIRLISIAVMERLIQHNGGVERLQDWTTDAQESKAILRAARRRQIRLTSVESGNLQYAINRALGMPVAVADVTYRDEAATIAALTRYARRVEEERRQRVREVSA